MAVTSARDLFDAQMPGRLAAAPDIAAKINAVYKFVITGAEGGTWTVDLTQAGGGKVSATDAAADCTITINAKDLVDVVNGKLNAQMAFMTGKLKVAGDIGLALKLGTLLR